MIFPTPCPPPSAWTIKEPTFNPERIWELGGDLIKTARKRRVIRADDFFIKAFCLLPGPASRIRDPARKEWIISERLAERGLTPRPAAYGIYGRWSYFAARAASGKELGRYLEQDLADLSRKEIREFEKIFSRFLLDIAEAGVFQPDFHLDNVFYQEETRRLLLLDLHRARLYDRPLTHLEIMEQLIYVMPPFVDMLSGRNLIETASFLSKRVPALKKRDKRYEIQELSFSNMRSHWMKKEKRKVFKEHLVSRANGLLKLRTSSTDRSVLDQLGNLINKPETWSRQAGSSLKILKDSRHTLCIRALIEQRPFFIKAYRSSGHLKSFSYLFRTPRAIKTWQLSYRLSYRNIPVVLPLAAVQAKNPWNKLYGAVIFPWIKEAEDTKKLIRMALEREPDNHILKELALFVWQMHEKGVVHGDCKITNFIYGPRSHKKFMIFDLDSTQILKRAKDKMRISDIACLCRSLEKLAPDSDITKSFLNHYARFHLPWHHKWMDIAEKVRQLNLKKALAKE